ncbi:unnamed protein product [Adineta steineri]|uniref:General transcription factor IIH subunit 4 n=1 Tax=Adineta steineri TaxID=433720 RepID=A0A814XGL5_9BILA|nr:unnamed protein product [Adineta steineri]
MSGQFANLQEYISSLPTNVTQNIYGHPASCLAIFRELPVLARTIIMRFICLPNSELTGQPQPISQGVASSWINPSHQNTYKNITRMLVKLGIWNEVGTDWQLDATFRNNLTGAIFGGTTNWLDETDSVSTPSERSIKKLEELNTYSSTRWDCVLQYLVNPDRGQITRDTIDVFVHAKLLKRNDDTSSASTDPYQITGTGFQFLLMNRRTQVWFFIINSLETRQQRGEDISEHLIFLFQLSFATFGKDYSCEKFSATKENFLQHLRELGLIWQKTRKIKRYFPTKLAIELASGLATTTYGEHGNDEIQSGFLVVETNYRVYAYTNNDLYLRITALFCKMLYRFPNMSVGLITRQSIRKALSNEISADLILNFLKSHAHPQMRKRLLENKPLIPTTISDQIRLWEMERDRIVDQEGMLYSQFNSANDFELIEKYAKDLNVLLWSNSQKRCVIVSKAGHEERKIKRYFPTKLAIELASGLATTTYGEHGNDEIQSGFLVVETNYRVYAYTNNDLYLRITALFCKMLYRFPNMSVGLITRQSIRKALSNEISADLILNFLKSHAHPQMRKRLLENKPLIPTTISDQIRLWEMERDRIVDQEGMLYSQFNSANDFELIEKYAKDLNVLLWSNSQKRCVIVSKAGHEEVKRFWKMQRPKGSND